MAQIMVGGNSFTLVAAPSSPGFSEVSFSLSDAVAIVQSPYVPSQMQAQSWPGADAWSAQVTLPKMTELQAGPWVGFLAALRGRLNVFQLGDPARCAPLGSALGSPVVNSGVANVLFAPGSGYGSAPSLGASGGGGSDFAATVTEAGGQVTAVSITDAGQQFTSPPTLSFSGGSPTTAATATAVLSNQPFTTLLYTRGWRPGTYGLLLPKDYIQIGYRLYMVCQQVNSDANGYAQICVWPSLRETPADGTTLQLVNCKGLFRLASNERPWNTTVDKLTHVSLNMTEVR